MTPQTARPASEFPASRRHDQICTQCDGYLDPVCEDGVDDYCLCMGALFESCTPEAREQAYVDCFTGVTELYECWSGNDIQTIEQCEMLIAECGR